MTTVSDTTTELQLQLPAQPPAELSGRRVSIFQVRDYLEKNLPGDITTKEIVVLDVLLLHTLFNGDSYGRVTFKHSSFEFLKNRTRLSDDSISRALKNLSGHKFVTRDTRGRKRHQHDVIRTKPLLDLVAEDLYPAQSGIAATPHTAVLSNPAESGIAARARSSSLEELEEERLIRTSSLRDLDDDRLDIGEIVQKQLPGEGASPRVGGGAGGEDHHPAKSQEGLEAPASAAPPGGGAPAAAPGPASRKRREDRGQDDPAMCLARELQEESGGIIIARRIVGNLRRLAPVYGLAVVASACTWGTKYTDRFLPGDGSNDKGAVFNSNLEDMVQAYVQARDEKVAELGIEDPSGFDLVAYLDQEVEEEERAEHEVDTAKTPVEEEFERWLGAAAELIARVEGLDIEAAQERALGMVEGVRGGLGQKIRRLEKIRDTYMDKEFTTVHAGAWTPWTE